MEQPGSHRWTSPSCAQGHRPHLRASSRIFGARQIRGLSLWSPAPKHTLLEFSRTSRGGGQIAKRGFQLRG